LATPDRTYVRGPDPPRIGRVPRVRASSGQGQRSIQEPCCVAALKRSSLSRFEEACRETLPARVVRLTEGYVENHIVTELERLPVRRNVRAAANATPIRHRHEV
jgi:hypothetical protein